MRAGLRRGFGQRRAQPLPRHFQQSERADAADLDARPIVFQRLLQAALDRDLVAVLLHVDEVDHDQPREVAQPQLARDLVGGFEIGAQRGFLDVALAGRTPGIDVDRDQRLGLVDDEVAARTQLRDRRMDRVDLALDLKAVEQPDLLIAIGLHPLCVARHQRAHERLGGAVALFALDQHLVEVARVEVADRALDQVAFLVDQRRRRRAQRQVADLVPQPQQIFVIALDFGLRAFGAGGADDDPHAFGNVEFLENVLEPAPVGEAGDLARHAAAAVGVRHQHAIASRQREIGRQRRALVAALLLGDLHQHDLAALDDLLDLVVPHRVAPPPLRRVGLLDLLDLVAAQRFDTVRHPSRHRRRRCRRIPRLGRRPAAPSNSARRLVRRLIVWLPALAGGFRDIRFRDFRGDDRFLGGAQRDRRRFAVPCDPLARPSCHSRLSPAVSRDIRSGISAATTDSSAARSAIAAGSRSASHASSPRVRSVTTGSSVGSGAAVTAEFGIGQRHAGSVGVDVSAGGRIRRGRSEFRHGINWRSWRHRSRRLRSPPASPGASSRGKRPGGPARGRRPPRRAPAPLAVRRPLLAEIVLGLALRDLHRLRQGRGKRHAGILAAAGAIVAGVVAMTVRRLVRYVPCGSVADRDAVVIGMDFAERQEPMPVSAIIDKSSLQRGFYAGYFCEIYISFYLPFC